MSGIATPTVRDGEYGFLEWPDCDLGCPVPVPSCVSSSTRSAASTAYCYSHSPRTPDFLVQDECWLWLKAVINSGYGVLGADDKVRTAHRVAYERSHGGLEASMHVHHLCENKRCLQPDHLVALSPGAHRRLRAKLTWDDVFAIRRRAERGERAVSITPDYPVGVASIRHVIAGRTWPPEAAGEADLLKRIRH